MNEAKIAAMGTLKGLLETHGAEGVFEMLAEAVENLMGAANPENEGYAREATKKIKEAQRAARRAEIIIEATLAGSLEVLIECQSDEEWPVKEVSR